jgi:phosphoenolpyruvate carboxykinase (GTP)
LPFCGYNMADYWAHWLEIGATADPQKLPKIFMVNWFRRDADGNFIWPGFGENARVLDWIMRRVDGTAAAIESPIGLHPADGELPTEGLELPADALAELFAIDADRWLQETDLTETYFDTFGDKVPDALRTELTDLRDRLSV